MLLLRWMSDDSSQLLREQKFFRLPANTTKSELFVDNFSAEESGAWRYLVQKRKTHAEHVQNRRKMMLTDTAGFGRENSNTLSTARHFLQP